MQNWDTTLPGILAAVGQVMQQAGGVPHWFNVAGAMLSAAGIAWLGYAAVSIRGVQSQIDGAPDTTTSTLTITEKKTPSKPDEKPTNT